MYIHTVSNMLQLHNFKPTELNPLKQNVLLGSTAVFNCHTSGAFILDWAVDGIQVNDIRIRSRGILSHTVTANESCGIKHSNLTLLASAENNQSSVQCIAISMAGLNARSEVVKLFIQGKYQCINTDIKYALGMVYKDIHACIT